MIGERGPMGLPGQLPLVEDWIDRVYYEGDVVAHAGGLYQAQGDTAREPGNHADWRCLARPGRNGQDGRSFNVLGTYDASAEYQALDVVTLNATWFVAKHDKPGPCPGEGWKAGPTARRGEKGEAGQRGLPGLKGDKGDAGRDLVGWEIDKRNYAVIPVMNDGSKGPPISLRGLFDQFHSEAI
jgi:hypothetical protein